MDYILEMVVVVLIVLIIMLFFMKLVNKLEFIDKLNKRK